MAPRHRASVISVVATALLLLAGAANADLCASADYKALCRAVVKQESDAVEATARAIQATMVQLRNAKSSATKFGTTAVGMGKSNAGTCNEVYDDAISSLLESLKNLRSRDVGSLNSNLSAAMSDVSTCEDGFKENPGMDSPLAALNQRLHKLASNNLALASEVP